MTTKAFRDAVEVTVKEGLISGTTEFCVQFRITQCITADKDDIKYCGESRITEIATMQLFEYGKQFFDEEGE